MNLSGGKMFLVFSTKIYTRSHTLQGIFCSQRFLFVCCVSFYFSVHILWWFCLTQKYVFLVVCVCLCHSMKDIRGNGNHTKPKIDTDE